MIKLQLLGGFAVVDSESPLDALPRRRALALLAAAAVAAPQPIAREKMLGLLWPESDETRARNSLRQTIYALRRDLHGELFLPETAAGLQLDLAQIQVDLIEFRDALARGEPAAAVDLYRGPLLDGFYVPGLASFSQWVESERERIERCHIEALSALAQCAEREDRFDDAVTWRQRQAAADPLSSRAALALLKALAAAGDRAGALRHAARHDRLIREQLEVEPDPVVTEFVASLRRDALPLDQSRLTPPDAPRIPVTPASGSVVSAAAPAAAAEVESVPVQQGAIVRRRRARPSWFLTGAIALLGLTLVASRWVRTASGSPPSAWPTVIILGSGSHPVSGRDPANRLISCNGPACPSERLPQDAYVLAANPAYSPPISGTSYIGPVPDATSIASPGYACCTTATFESTFRLPPDASAATVSVSTLADNRVAVSINGVEFLRQLDSLSDNNFGQGDRHTTTFAPDPSGTNRLTVTLWDGGGALGLEYLATVTYRRSPDPHKGTADSGQPEK